MSTEKYTKKGMEALNEAQNLALLNNHQEITPTHFLCGLLSDKSGLIASLLSKMGKSSEALLKDGLLELESLPKVTGSGVKVYYSTEGARVLAVANELSKSQGDEYVGVEHIFTAILKSSYKPVKGLLSKYSISLSEFEKRLKEVKTAPISTDDPEQNYDVLQKYGYDLVERARSGKIDPVIGRDEEIRNVIRILSRKTKNNPVLIGEPGVGKTAIVEALASRIISGDVPDTVKDKRVLTLDLAGMIAGTKYRGEFEERIKRAIKEVTNDGRILLFIDEVHTIIGAGGAEGAIDASNILKPSLARGELQIIGATTITEYRKYIE